ncbi:hypothetical protein M9H77_31508 [Catharanthus roseus]|uniref:Uncharacterized protein n=1 Tax=Catharanthus roseus TaxID=4058 RepID=A0ACC0A191_CATRO|nr:hypothetical protein M9H77_31508 [Catharanthus roseus]
MSPEAQLPIPHNERTSESPHSNLDQMKDMTDMRRDKTNLCMEHRGRRNMGGDVTPHTQRGYRSYNPRSPYETAVQSTHQFYDGGRPTTPRGGRHGELGGRAYQRPHEEFQRDEPWHEDNLGIEHQIDFLPGTVLPNSPAYPKRPRS